MLTTGRRENINKDMQYEKKNKNNKKKQKKKDEVGKKRTSEKDKLTLSIKQSVNKSSKAPRSL